MEAALVADVDLAEVARKIGAPLAREGLNPLLFREHLPAFIKYAQDHHLVIGRMEGLRFSNGEIIPQMDAIADFDFSSVNSDSVSEMSCRWAMAFISGVQDIDFDVVDVVIYTLEQVNSGTL
jgi:hypothetical protein